MKIGISNDHGGLQLKNKIVWYLKNKGFEVINYGTDSSDSYDYPIAAKLLCEGYNKHEFEYGIAICSTGIGISIACNKHKGIRACCCSETLSAKMTREHNDANIICFGEKIVSPEKAFEIVDIFLSTPFSNGERHIRRISQIADIENNR